MYIDIQSLSLFVLLALALYCGSKYYQFRSGLTHRDPSDVGDGDLMHYGANYRNGVNGFPKIISIAKKYYYEAINRGWWEGYFYLVDIELNENKNPSRACRLLRPTFAVMDLDSWLVHDSLNESTKNLAKLFAKAHILERLYRVCGNPYSARIKHDRLLYCDPESEWDFKEHVEKSLQPEIDELLPEAVDKKDLTYNHGFIEQVYKKYKKICKTVEKTKELSSKSLEPLELPRREVLKKLEEFRGDGLLVKTLTYQACEEAIEYLSVKNPTIEIENFDPNEKPLNAGHLIDMLVLLQRWVKNNPERDNYRGDMPSEQSFLEMDVEKVREYFFEFLTNKGADIDRQGYEALVYSDKVVGEIIGQEKEAADKKLKKFIKSFEVS